MNIYTFAWYATQVALLNKTTPPPKKKNAVVLHNTAVISSFQRSKLSPSLLSRKKSHWHSSVFGYAPAPFEGLQGSSVQAADGGDVNEVYTTAGRAWPYARHCAHSLVKFLITWAWSVIHGVDLMILWASMIAVGSAVLIDSFPQMLSGVTKQKNKNKTTFIRLHVRVLLILWNNSSQEYHDR